MARGFYFGARIMSKNRTAPEPVGRWMPPPRPRSSLAAVPRFDRSRLDSPANGTSAPALRRDSGPAEDRDIGASRPFGGRRAGDLGRDDETTQGPTAERGGGPFRGSHVSLAGLRTPDPAALLGLHRALGRAAEATSRTCRTLLPTGTGDRQATFAGVHPDRAGGPSLDARARHPLTAAGDPGAAPALASVNSPGRLGRIVVGAED